MLHARSQTVVLAGASGDLGRRIGKFLSKQNTRWRALVRVTTTKARRRTLEEMGAVVCVVDYNDLRSLMVNCVGADCVISALNGLYPVVVDAQINLLKASVEAGVRKFIPSDYSLDYTKTAPGLNRNLDLRRTFRSHADMAPIRVTSILNGAFSELLTGQAPILMPRISRVLYWGELDQQVDFTTKDDVARFVAAVARDEKAPRFLRIAGDVTTPRKLAIMASKVTGRSFKPMRLGGVNQLSVAIRLTQMLTPVNGEIFPVWQGMQYQRDMSMGDGKLDPLDNDRFGASNWTSCREVLSRHLCEIAAA